MLFPFAKLVWDEIKALIFKGQFIAIIPMNAEGFWFIGVKYVGKVMINLLLFISAPCVAPLGILYLWSKNRDAA